MVGLEGAGETEGSRIWGMRASWLMITGWFWRQVGCWSKGQVRVMSLPPWMVHASEMMHALVDSGPRRWAQRQN